MKCLEAVAGRPSGAEQIQGGGRLAVNYTAVLPGNLQPGAGPGACASPKTWHTVVGVLSAQAAGDQGALSTSTSRTWVTGSPAAGGQ